MLCFFLFHNSGYALRKQSENSESEYNRFGQLHRIQYDACGGAAGQENLSSQGTFQKMPRLPFQAYQLVSHATLEMHRISRPRAIALYNMRNSALREQAPASLFRRDMRLLWAMLPSKCTAFLGRGLSPYTTCEIRLYVSKLPQAFFACYAWLNAFA